MKELMQPCEDEHPPTSSRVVLRNEGKRTLAPSCPNAEVEPAVSKRARVGVWVEQSPRLARGSWKS
jgi:hypothetical protein